MKKLIVLTLVIFLLTGCTVVRIKTDDIDNIINVILSKDNKLFNRVGKGYKYYIPRGVSYIDTRENNEKLYSNGNHYYLYVDVISYYYKKEFSYEEQKDAYYSRLIDMNNKKGFLEINKVDNLYLIKYIYNYAKIEALVEEKDINQVVLDATYILSTIKFNSDVIKIMLDDELFINKEEKYDLFTPKKETNNFIEYIEEIEE
ncbi:MAG: hypothetical protein PHO63_05215 [Bacilli bacterium]|nr:hypothetical protein [Bacilli bacterium]MDD4808623.1 hypothetical protein [Bacilli bacterium]